jgi:hypothetical protein
MEEPKIVAFEENPVDAELISTVKERPPSAIFGCSQHRSLYFVLAVAMGIP